MRILHVDDAESTREIIQRILRGHEVTSCASLQEAKDAYSRGRYGLVICDGEIEQPYDGFAWAAELHATGQNVVILSGSEYQGDIPFLAKNQPYREADFLQFID